MFGKQRIVGAVVVLLAAFVLVAGCGQTGDKGKDGSADKDKGKDTAQAKDEKGKTGSKETPTVLHIPHLNDQGCIDSVKAELVKVEGVDTIQADLKTKTVKVFPKAGKVLSPKALWEAADASGESPNKLDGPSGLFTSKPKE